MTPEARARWHGRRALRGPVTAKVRKAILRGDLAPASQFKCMDCPAQAQVYDHRDYDQPLCVEPVCRKCNALRGPAKQLQHLTAAYVRRHSRTPAPPQQAST